MSALARSTCVGAVVRIRAGDPIKAVGDQVVLMSSPATTAVVEDCLGPCPAADAEGPDEPVGRGTVPPHSGAMTCRIGHARSLAARSPVRLLQLADRRIRYPIPRCRWSRNCCATVSASVARPVVPHIAAPSMRSVDVGVGPRRPASSFRRAIRRDVRRSLQAAICRQREAQRAQRLRTFQFLICGVTLRPGQLIFRPVARDG